MSVSDRDVSFSLQINVDDRQVAEIRKLQTLLYRSLALMRRMGLSEDADRAIAKIQEIIAMLNAWRLAITAFYAASGPIGWGLAAVGFAGAALTTASFFPDPYTGVAGY